MMDKKLNEKDLYIDLDGVKVVRAHLADVIWQGCKSLCVEIDETTSEGRTLFLLSCLYGGYIYHYMILGLNYHDSVERAKELIEDMGLFPIAIVQKYYSDMNECFKQLLD